MRRAVDPGSLPLFVLVAAVGVALAWVVGRGEALAAEQAAVGWQEDELGLQRERAALAARLGERGAAEWEVAERLGDAVARRGIMFEHLLEWVADVCVRHRLAVCVDRGLHCVCPRRMAPW